MERSEPRLPLREGRALGNLLLKSNVGSLYGPSWHCPSRHSAGNHSRDRPEHARRPRTAPLLDAATGDLPRLPASGRHGTPARHPAADRGRGASRARCRVGELEPRIDRGAAETIAPQRPQDRRSRGRLADSYPGEYRRRRGAWRPDDLVRTGPPGEGRIRVGFDDQTDRHAADGRRGIDETELRSGHRDTVRPAGAGTRRRHVRRH